MVIMFDASTLAHMGDQLLASGQTEPAIQAYLQALNAPAESVDSAWTTDAYARTVCQLASAIVRRTNGDLATNIEDAIDVCRRALEFMAPDELSDVLFSDGRRIALAPGGRRDGAMLFDQLGQACMMRLEGDKGENVEIALRAFHQALAWTGRTSDPVNWAARASSLATALLSRVEGEPEVNTDNAINLQRQAVEVFAASGDVERWAAAATNLARSWLLVGGPSRTASVQRAIGLFQDVLRTRARDTNPFGWASTSVGLAHAYIELGNAAGGQSVTQAVQLCEDVLAEPAMERFPTLKAQAYQLLALASGELPGSGRD
jgi:tetratricopeptide (TPR) repeat protein